MRQPGDTLQSARLSLRRLTLDDLDWFARLLGDPAVARFLGGAKDRAAATTVLRVRGLDYYPQHPGLGMWATLERTTGQAIGFHVLNHIHGEPDIQVGYALFPVAWGRGYATEMSVRLLEYGFEDLALPEITAIANLDHFVSHRVLLKAGLARRGERTFTHPALAGQGPMAWFVAERAGWLSGRPRVSPGP